MTKTPQPYKESDDHVPNPLHQSGVVDTTGTTGDLGGKIDNISPVFAQAKADAFAGSVEALDDPNIDESEKIVFHDEDEHLSHEEQEQRIRDAAKESAEAAKSGISAAQAEAAKTGDDGAGSTTNKTNTDRKAAAGNATQANPAKKTTAAKKTAGR